MSIRTGSHAARGTRRSVTPDLAHRLARVFHTTPDVWLTMQQAVDVWDTFTAHKEEYARITPLKVA